MPAPRQARANRSNSILLAFGAAVMTLTIGLIGYTKSDFLAWGFATDLELRVAMVFFVIALAARPVLRLSGTRSEVEHYRTRNAWLCFGGSYLAVLLSVLASVVMRTPSVSKVGLFFFNAPILAVLIVAAAYHNPIPSRVRISVTFFFLSVSYFWIIFAFAAVAGLSSPTGTDPYSAVLLALLALLLPVRVLDSVMQGQRTATSREGRLAEKPG